ncbi:MAG: alpha/beta hydrolase [Hyphomicrobiales bacterium]|nr:alpha/beta hydrolase [Hyphomicrobiales bacterium]
MASHLWEDFRVVVPDLQGHGLVDTQGVLQSIDTAADEVAAAIRHMRLGKVTLVGCSMGGTVAQSVALRHRDVVVQLGLIATFAKGGQAHANRATLAETEGVAAQLPGTLTRWFDAETLARNGPEINYIKDVLGRTPLDRWAAAWRAMAVVDNLERLPTLDIPVLTIAGGADSSTQDEMMRGFSTSIPYSRHVTLPDAMHMMILTHPAEIAADLKALADDGAHSRPESFAKGRRQ